MRKRRMFSIIQNWVLTLTLLISFAVAKQITVLTEPYLWPGTNDYLIPRIVVTIKWIMIVTVMGQDRNSRLIIILIIANIYWAIIIFQTLKKLFFVPYLLLLRAISWDMTIRSWIELCLSRRYVEALIPNTSEYVIIWK